MTQPKSSPRELNALFVGVQCGKTLTETVAINPKRVVTKARRLGIKGTLEIWKCVYDRHKGTANEDVQRYYQKKSQDR